MTSTPTHRDSTGSLTRPGDDAPDAATRRAIDTLRMLAVDAVEAANSGHPGTPMALAPLGYRIFQRHLRFDPSDPDWPNRDRFVLSCGHASMLLYGLLYMSGYALTLDDLRNFRELDAKTAGHPERGLVAGVETTTGPLGQGLANAVGMALAERMLAARVNAGETTIVDHHTYVLASDGDIMEGIQSEAASLAGHLRLGKLIVFYDDNHITIDGNTEITLTEDVGARYAAYGWHVLHLDDSEDLAAIDATIEQAHADERPTLVVMRSHIGIGSPLQDNSKAHGSPLGADNVKATREHYSWPAETFYIPEGATDELHAAAARGRAAHAAWNDALAKLTAADTELGALCKRLFDPARPLPTDWAEKLDALANDPGDDPLATRVASERAINAIAARVPEFVGGSADLAGSNNTTIKDASDVCPDDFSGRNIHFGVREHGMAGIGNGMLCHGGLRTFVATFLIFSDYMRPSIRLAALSELPEVFVFSHDSVWLGQDGPTHQPIEQLISLRAIPNLIVMRPADITETAQAWRVALEQRNRPTALALTRQKLPQLHTLGVDAHSIRADLGAYIAVDCDGEPELTLIGTGSEVVSCIKTAATLRERGRKVRVVSMPSWELFSEQSAQYKSSVLASTGIRIAVEAGSPMGWERWVGTNGTIIGIDRFGTSAPGEQAAKALGLGVDTIISRCETALADSKQTGNQ